MKKLLAVFAVLGVMSAASFADHHGDTHTKKQRKGKQTTTHETHTTTTEDKAAAEDHNKADGHGH